MNSSYISSSIFHDKQSYFSQDEETKVKSLRFSQALKNIPGKNFSSKLNNLISTRDNLRKSTQNPIPTEDR